MRSRGPLRLLHNGAGRILVLLGLLSPAKAAYPQDKPLLEPPVVWVHYDYMAGYDSTIATNVNFAPPPEAIQMVVDSFRKHGVILHIDPQHNVIPYHEVVIPDWDPAWQQVSTNCTGNDAVSFMALKAAYFTPKDNRPWHYAIFVHNAGLPDTSVGSACPGDALCGGFFDPFLSGISETPGFNFMVAFGADVDQGFSISQGRWAGTFMHELGHNFGLRHGGIYADSHESCLTFKPNYVSVMGYSYQNGIAFSTNGNPDFSQAILAGQFRVDYSDETLPTLNEADLNEPAGVGSVQHPNDIVRYFSGSTFASAFASGPVDWDLDGTATNLNVAVDLDIDNGTPNAALSGFNDWAYIHQFIGIPAYLSGQVHGATSNQ
jgi:hypothetical protein